MLELVTPPAAPLCGGRRPRAACGAHRSALAGMRTMHHLSLRAGQGRQTRDAAVMPHMHTVRGGGVGVSWAWTKRRAGRQGERTGGPDVGGAVCVSCHASCETCSAASATSCVTCPAAGTPLKDDGACVAACACMVRIEKWSQSVEDDRKHSASAREVRRVEREKTRRARQEVVNERTALKGTTTATEDDEGEDEPHFGQPKHRPCELVDEPHGHEVQGLFNELGHELDHHDHRQMTRKLSHMVSRRKRRRPARSSQTR